VRDVTDTALAPARAGSVRQVARRILVTPSGRRLHLTKMVTWRVVATATTIVITYSVTGDLLIGATVGGLEATAKMALYYGHERAWASVVADAAHA
jgi:uncharacterized membrane protein